MTNFDVFKQNMALEWVADVIDNSFHCEDCPAKTMCDELYPDDEEGVCHCHDTITRWLKTEVE